MTLGFVDRIYVINLPERTDRRRELRRQFEQVGWDPDDPAICYFKATKTQEAGPFPSVGARGCFLSHLGVLRAAAQSGFSAIAIMEDDLNFVDDFTDRIDGVREALAAADWSVFYGGYDVERAPASDAAIAAAQPALELRTTHFICLRGSAIALARDYLAAMLTRPAGDPEGGPMHVDGAYQWFRGAFPQLRAFIATPPLGFQRSSKSDVAPQQWFDKTTALAGAVAVLRRLKRRLR